VSPMRLDLCSQRWLRPLTSLCLCMCLCILRRSRGEERARPAPRPAAEAQAAAFIDQYNALHRPLSLMEMHQQVVCALTDVSVLCSSPSPLPP
jgi:hypothetical protein